jgi:hypothetical protein
MNDQMADQTNQPLAQELHELRRWVAFPTTPDLAAAVSVRLREERRPRHSLLHGGRRTVLVAAAVILLAIVAATTLSGTVRDVVADALGIPGVRIEIDRDEPTTTPTSTSQELNLGLQVPLTEVPQHAGFIISALDPEDHGFPDATYVRRLPDGTSLVSLTYLADEALPNTAETNLGVLLMEFEANEDFPSMAKSVRHDGRIEDVRVNGNLGFWIEGSTELQILGDDPESRSSGNILLWQANGITYRMESALSMEQAITVAEEMTVIHPSLLTPTAEP